MTLRRPPSTVAWGWRPGDVQLCSDEDWRQQVRLARQRRAYERALKFAHRQARAMAQLQRTAAEMREAIDRAARAWRRGGLEISLVAAAARDREGRR